jgi:hypothetical protein
MTEIYSSHFWKLGCPRSGLQQLQYLRKAFWFIDGTFSLSPHMAEGARQLSVVSYNPIHESTVL